MTCSTALSTNPETFDIYLTEQSFAELALSALCSNPVIQRQFGNVRVTIGENDYDTFRYISHGVSNLALVKANVVTAFGADEIYGYEEVAMHPDYSAYFIALKEKPELTKEYLLGKRIGILDYPSSRSGHIVPKTRLKALGLNTNNIHLHYYNSHGELRRALLAGDVDIISSYWDKNDGKKLSRSYITALEESVSGMRWYLKMQTRNTDLRCAVQSAIQTMSANQTKKYYQQVQIEEPCIDAVTQ
ncbi:PhnD/SsuA/transferrin family substrate-binding protein [Aestuariibacter sp. A3R04]|uniref:PhnD/SsuA/transferrin family substrate-binding protein n=1 Tax=Aestuariibacter sp. A3R04 TaxID=2841571 RepID=UPI002091934C|nr:PhnD/SsuA/transferrin family substrate-binding protein [Aestuariibacter sp. A3R04]